MADYLPIIAIAAVSVIVSVGAVYIILQTITRRATDSLNDEIHKALGKLELLILQEGNGHDKTSS